jgi:hypothetical protein
MSTPPKKTTARKETIGIGPSAKDKDAGIQNIKAVDQTQPPNAHPIPEQVAPPPASAQPKPSIRITQKKGFTFGNVFNSSRQKFLFVLIIITILVVPTWFLFQRVTQANSRPVLGIAPGNYYVWQEDSATRVDPLYMPIADPANIQSEISLAAAKREYESTQVVVRKLSTSITTNLTFSITPFLDNNKNVVIPRENITLTKAILIRDQFFDRLEPVVSPMDVNENRNYPFLFTVYVPESTPAGIYTSTVNITADRAAPISFTVKLRVYNFALPLQRSYQSMIKPFTKNFNFMDQYFSHRVDFAGVPMNFSFNKMTMVWTFEWAEWDSLTQYSLDNGQAVFEISNPLGHLKDFKKYSAEYNFSLVSFYNQVANHLSSKGWLDMAYIYVLDEPSYEECVEFEPFCELVHAVNPDLRILLTTVPRDEIKFLYDDIDIWAPIEHDLDRHFDTLKMLQKEGAEIVYYPCLFPKTPYANIQIYNPLIDTKVLAWQVFRWGLDGFLYWQTIAYYYNAHGYGYNGWLDGWLLYAVNATDGLYDSSLRWDALRDGFEDIEYFYLLESLGKQFPDFKARVDTILAIMEHIMPGFRDFSQNPEDYFALRSKAALLIEEILG